MRESYGKYNSLMLFLGKVRRIKKWSVVVEKIGTKMEQNLNSLLHVNHTPNNSINSVDTDPVVLSNPVIVLFIDAEKTLFMT